MSNISQWSGKDSFVSQEVDNQRRKTEDVYRIDRARVLKDKTEEDLA